MVWVDVGFIVDGVDVEVWIVVVDILFFLNVVLFGIVMLFIVVDGMYSDNFKIVIFIKIKKKIYESLGG